MNKKCISIIIFSVLMSVLFQITAFAYNSEQSTANAVYLKALGILQGNKRGLELEKNLTRTEAAIVAIRMNGNEKEALSCTDDVPFSDVPEWSKSYIAYAYKTGIINGISDNMYGASRPVTLNQFSALMLRIAGYKDDVDFEYRNSYRFAYDLGAMKYLAYNGSFLRRDMADICAGFLETAQNGKSETMYEKLKSLKFFNDVEALVAEYTRDNILNLGNESENNINADELDRLMREEEEKNDTEALNEEDDETENTEKNESSESEQEE